MSLLVTILICAVALLACVLVWAIIYIRYLSDQLDAYTGVLDPVWMVDGRREED